MLTDAQAWRRRLVMPLLAVLVVAALSTWNYSRRGVQDREVRQFADALAVDLATGHDLGRWLTGTDPMLAAGLGPRLAEVAQRAGGSAERIQVAVARGDWPGAGAAGGQASHTAVLFVNGDEALGLRLVHQGGSRPVAIIGFWTPPG